MTSGPLPPLSETDPNTGESGTEEINRQFFDPLWRDARLIEGDRFNTWPLVQSLVARHPRRLEIGPGLRPRLPLGGTTFIDLSPPAAEVLNRHGANALVAPVSALPVPDASFDLVCALDIIEHVNDDEAAFAEISRVAAPGATFLLSVPLFDKSWTGFDDLVGHCRRYEPEALISRLRKHGFQIDKSAVFGMQPRSSRLTDLGMWCLKMRRTVAMRWYNNVFMPIGLFLQKPLVLADGFVYVPRMDEVLLVCSKFIV